MSNVVKPPRPKTGQVTTREIRVKVCTHCHFAMDDCGLCSYDCEVDAEPRTSNDFFYAVYRRTDEFLRDEAVTEGTNES